MEASIIFLASMVCGGLTTLFGIVVGVVLSAILYKDNCPVCRGGLK